MDILLQVRLFIGYCRGLFFLLKSISIVSLQLLSKGFESERLSYFEL